MTEDKNTNQSADTENTDPLAAPETDIDLSKEVDADDALHAAKDIPSKENLQQDTDDAIHKNYKPAPDPLHENDERDPDDIIHGG